MANPDTFNIYCDESCHLEKDSFKCMAIGYTKIDIENYNKYKEALLAIRNKFNFHAEIKWVKVSQSRIDFYKAYIDFFFQNNIDFRCILIKYKDKLDHVHYNEGDANKFYYKMVFYLLRAAVNPPDSHYRIYLDIKDTRGRERLKTIKEIFSSHYRQHSPFVYFQHIRSHENIFMQITDLFIGAITYKTRKEHLNEKPNPAKMELISYIEKWSGAKLDEGTVPWESKFNIFDHQPNNIKNK